MNEESKQLMRRIVESMAWRQTAAINNFGHSLRYIDEFDVKTEVVSELDLSLRLFGKMRALYAELGWTDLESAIRDRLEGLPFPASRLEFGASYFVSGIVESVAMGAYVNSSCAEFAAIARAYVEAAARRLEPKRFIEYCGEETNRPHAQQLWDRWSAIALHSFGRPGSPSDARAVELGLRSITTTEMAAQFRARVDPFLERCGLTLRVDSDASAAD